MKPQPQPLLDQESALGAYFDAMMLSADSVPAAAPVSQADDGATQAEAAPVGAEPAPDSITALLFDVAGLTLAVPMSAVKAVTDYRAASPHTGLFLGEQVHEGAQVTVVDTARLVLPAERATRLGGTPGDRIRQLIILDDARWALGCDGRGEVVELDRAGIKWRTAEGKRPWLAGMVTDKRYALLDVEGLKALLETQMA